MKDIKKSVPKIPLWILKKSSPSYDYLYLKSNFQELYERTLTDKGRFQASIWIWGEVLKSFPGLILALLYWRFTMFRSYMLIALRNFRKNKMYAFLNIAGLAIGLACCILILLYADFEFSYDKYHKNTDRIFRPVTDEFTGSSYLLGQRLLEEVPGIEDVARFKNISKFEQPTFRFKDKSFEESGFWLTDQAVFNIFDLPFIYGSPENSLNSPDSIVLTESTAIRYFGTANPVGKTMLYNNKTNFSVRGVIKDLPENSHLAFDILASASANMKVSGHDDRLRWSSGNYKTYLLLNEGVEPSAVGEKIAAILQASGSKAFFNKNYRLQPLKEIHLYSHLRGEFKENGDIRYIYLYSAIGVIILLIACINFINLASAHSLNRSLEIGIRKVLGALREQVIRQFIGESVLFAWLALPAALILAKFFLPLFNNLVNAHITFGQINSFFIIGSLIGLTTLVGLLSGSYPAFFSSSFSPVKAIKGKDFSRKAKKISMRNVLLTVQFAVSAVFISCTLIIIGQINFIRNMNLGVETDHVINIPVSKTVSEKANLIKYEFLKHPDVENVTISNFLPSSHTTTYQGGEWEGRAEEDIDMFRFLYVDHDFLETFNIQLVEGRNFSRDIQSDMGRAFILNETAVRTMDLSSPLDKMFRIEGRDFLPGKIIGVVKDFNFRSLHYSIDPMVLYIPPDHPKWLFFSTPNFSVKTSGRNLAAVLSHLKSSFNKHMPNQPYDYYFIDEDFDKAYKTEQKRGRLYQFFALMSILIACLGLYGLASFTAQRRTKEIGIRKVMGASIGQMVFLLTKESTKWVLISNIIACPIAYIIMHKWLQIFAYRININIGFFILSAVLTLLIAWLTSSYQSLKASLANPVDSLRYE